MSLSLFMDEHIKSAVTHGLRERGLLVITAQEDGSGGLPDTQLLDRAAILGCQVVTHDEDFLIEAARRQVTGASFPGIIFGPQTELSIGKMTSDLELIAQCYETADVANQVIFLPHK